MQEDQVNGENLANGKGEVVHMKKIPAIILSVAMLIAFIPAGFAFAGEVEDVYFTYTDTGVTAYTMSGEDKTVIASTESNAGTSNTSGTGFSLEGTTTTITADGTFIFSGSCSNGNIVVCPEDETDSDVEIEPTIELAGLTLTEPDEGSCPIQTKKDSKLELKAKKGTENILTDASHDGEKPKACINANKKLTIKGKGKLTVNGNNKNGIKSDTKINISSGDNLLQLNVNSVDNAISADEELKIESGNITIVSGGKGICATKDKAEVEEDGDNWVEYNNVSLEGGTVDITASDDAIHSNKDIAITGGTYTLNAASDDAIHADYNLDIGEPSNGEKTEKAASETTGPSINIESCYEGLEAEVVSIYSGDIDATASDDGINAVNPETKEDSDDGDAAGQDQGETQDQGGAQDNQRGQGEMQNQQTGQGETQDTQTGQGESQDRQPGQEDQQGNRPGEDGQPTPGKPVADDLCNINIYGGDVHVLGGTDGMDSNGNITISGGNTEVYASESKEASAALDCDGTLTITGGTVFAGGPSGMIVLPAAGGQTYKAVQGTFSSGSTVSITNGQTEIGSYTLPRAVKHIIFSSPEVTEETAIGGQSGGGDNPGGNDPTGGTGSGDSSQEQKSETVANAESVIGSINTSDISLDSEESIKAAREAYNALSDDEKAKVENYSELEKAEKALQEYKDKYVPAEPESQTESAGYDSVKISWPKSEKVDSYVIYRKSPDNADSIKAASNTGALILQEGFELINTVKPSESDSNEYTDTNLQTGVEYKYIVVAVNHDSKDRKIEVKSAEITATPCLGQVTGIKLTRGKKSAAVKWTAVAGATGYKVYRSTKKETGFKCVKTIKGKTVKFIDKKLQSKKTYYYKVKAFRTADGVTSQGACSEVKSVKTR